MAILLSSLSLATQAGPSPFKAVRAQQRNTATEHDTQHDTLELECTPSRGPFAGQTHEDILPSLIVIISLLPPLFICLLALSHTCNKKNAQAKQKTRCQALEQKEEERTVIWNQQELLRAKNAALEQDPIVTRLDNLKENEKELDEETKKDHKEWRRRYKRIGTLLLPS